MRKARIAKGTLLYHGTRVPDRFEPEPPNGPAWFSTSIDVARQFVYWHRWGTGRHRPRILVYETPAVVAGLARIDTKADLERLLGEDCDHYFGSDMVHDLAAAIRGRGYAGWLIPDNYNPGDDILILDTDVLKFANAVSLDKKPWGTYEDSGRPLRRRSAVTGRASRS